MIIADYLEEIKKTIINSNFIENFTITDSRIFLNRGYFRARLKFKNRDFVEIAETFTVIDNRLITLSYRYQWMDENKKQLKKRWDNVKHFPNLSNFPHHVHVGEEFNVKPSISRNILEIISLIETEIYTNN